MLDRINIRCPNCGGSPSLLFMSDDIWTCYLATFSHYRRTGFPMCAGCEGCGELSQSFVTAQCFWEQVRLGSSQPTERPLLRQFGLRCHSAEWPSLSAADPRMLQRRLAPTLRNAALLLPSVSGCESRSTWYSNVRSILRTTRMGALWAAVLENPGQVIYSTHIDRLVGAIALVSPLARGTHGA